MQEELKSIHKIVARDIAFGLKLSAICESRGLSYGTWIKVVNSPVFQDEVHRIEREIEDTAIEDHVNNPVQRLLQAEAFASVKRLAEERDSMEVENGASASTRIKAAGIILDKYFNKQEAAQQNIILNISEDKLKAIMGVPKIEPQENSVSL